MDQTCNVFQDILCWKWPHKLLPIPHFCTLTMCCAQLPYMSGSSCLVQHSSGSLSALQYLTPMQLLPVAYAEDTLKGKRYKDITEIQRNGSCSCRSFQTGQPNIYFKMRGSLETLYQAGSSYFEGDKSE